MNKFTSKLVSVIIPVYNEIDVLTEFINRATKSLSDAKLNFELIFIDDNSPDGSFEHLKSFESKSIKVYQKVGKRGKAFSLFEGFGYANGDAVVMIDSDLQYRPEDIPSLVKSLEVNDVVVADRVNYKESRLRKFLSRSFRNIVGKGLFGLKVDIQSGLKAFRKEVIEYINVNPSSGWSFDLEFLHRANQAGFTIGSVPIEFGKRVKGSSSVNVVKTALELGSNSLKVKSKSIKPVIFRPNGQNMQGAGIGHKKKKYTTHTTLTHTKSAYKSTSRKQKIVLISLIVGLVLSFYFYTGVAAIAFVSILSIIYFIDLLFNLYVTSRSLSEDREISISKKELDALSDDDLPVYTILCPLYNEGHIIPQFIKSIEKLDYPEDKLDVILLLEEDDNDLDEILKLRMPKFIRPVVVPASDPKTKPKACNYGLSIARGEYLVIYDAEDMPEPDQLKKAYLAFQKSDKNIICLQAKLNYYNPNQNLLTRFFTAEYSLWFDVTLTGLQSLNTTIPLGGTSNHFRTSDLLSLEGWDPFNVTEDADLGIRLFDKGYKTAIIDSNTLEEANSGFRNWLRQRSRWIKGYMQTYLVHMRSTLTLARKRGIHALIFHLVVGGKIAFILINPLLWIATISYFLLYQYVGPSIDKLYPPQVFYIAVTSLVFGNFLFLYYYMIGTYKKDHFGVVKYVFLIPIYWLMMSVASVMALYQLIFKPHYWEKTNHGLHLAKTNKKAKPANKIKPEVAPEEVTVWKPRRNIGLVNAVLNTRIAQLITSNKLLSSATILVVASGIGNFLNLLFNAYLSRGLAPVDFGNLSLFGALYGISAILFQPLGSTVNHMSAFYSGKYGSSYAYQILESLRKKAFIVFFVVFIVWIIFSGLLTSYFNLPNNLLILSFAIIWVVGSLNSIHQGYLMGGLFFISFAIVLLTEPLVKLITGIAIYNSQFSHYAYLAVPVSIVVATFVSIFLSRLKRPKLISNHKVNVKFPKKFFMGAMMVSLSTLSFVSLDVILAKHYLDPAAAGKYALFSLVGKMIFFVGALSTQFVLPLVSHNEGQNKSSTGMLYKLLIITSVSTVLAYVILGVFGMYTVPLVFNTDVSYYLTELNLLLIGMVLFTISRVFATYYLAKKIYLYSFVSFLVSLLLVTLIYMRHETIMDIVVAMFATGVLNFLFMSFLHIYEFRVKALEDNFKNIFEIILANEKPVSRSGLNILVFNWRDLKHSWSGGAEVYITEIGKRIVQRGHNVTLFSGNDGYQSRNDTQDGITVVRRGGRYLVYLWAFLYFVIKFRGKYDVVVDCENGIPFFTPLFVRKPKILLIHHIHQDVFNKHLVFPLSNLANFLEGTLMPILYKKSSVVTVSESSKQDIAKLYIADKSDISVITNGVDRKDISKYKKTKSPSFTYLGRLKEYKNIDVAIKAFSKVVKTIPNARLNIVGEGEDFTRLNSLVTELEMSSKVKFHGKVSEVVKERILAESWATLQPSMMEGFGLTVIESNACGTPVIASNVKGLRDAVINNATGILVKPHDIDQMAKAIRDIASDKYYRDFLSKQAYKWSTHFDWDESATLFLNKIIKEYESYQERRQEEGSQSTDYAYIRN